MDNKGMKKEVYRVLYVVMTTEKKKLDSNIDRDNRVSN